MNLAETRPYRETHLGVYTMTQPSTGSTVVTGGDEAAPNPIFNDYAPLPRCFDEFIDQRGKPRPVAADVCGLFDALGREELADRHRLSEHMLMRSGVTFSVYADNQGTEKIFPVDIIPRVIGGDDWSQLEKGLVQRVTALNLFLDDIYTDQRILKDGIIPRACIERCPAFEPKAVGFRPPGKTRVHIAGIDLIRDGEGTFRVLEDNLRTPSGVSYVLENRELMKRALPRVFASSHVRAVSDYPQQLREAMRQTAPEGIENPNLVVLTPGPFNSAYFEHSFLARMMGIELVQNSDLFVKDGQVWMHTTHGPEVVHVIYKRIDDDYLDPEIFNPKSMLGVPGLYNVYREGRVTLVNAIGNGVADDKGIYPYVPRIIKYYLDEEAIIGQVETLICAERDDVRKVLDKLDQYVVKKVDGAGGYGMLMGPSATKAELNDFRKILKQSPERYIAQPLVELSACPTWIDGKAAPRRVDLRPFIITGQSSWVLPGGLTRVALREGSYVVNSSQGGGSKDTWVLQGADEA